MTDFYTLAAGMTDKETLECARELLYLLSAGSGGAVERQSSDEYDPTASGTQSQAAGLLASIIDLARAAETGKQPSSGAQASAPGEGYMTLRRSVESPDTGIARRAALSSSALDAAREARSGAMETAAAYPTAEELSRLIARDSRRLDAAFERY